MALLGHSREGCHWKLCVSETETGEQEENSGGDMEPTHPHPLLTLPNVKQPEIIPVLLIQ